MSYTKSLGFESARLMTSLSNIGQSVVSIYRSQKVSGKGYIVEIPKLQFHRQKLQGTGICTDFRQKA